MKKEPFRLTLTHYGVTISTEIDYSDVSIEEVIQLIIGLLISAGFNIDNIKEYISDTGLNN